MMKKLWFLVVWFLGLLFLGSGASANYTQIFSDDFNRPDGTDIGSGREDTGPNWVLSGWNATSTGLTTSNKPLIRPDTFRDGKVEFVRSQGTGIYAPFAIARYTNSDNGGNYYVGWILGQGEVTITKVIDGVLYNDNALWIKIAKKTGHTFPAGSLKGEFIVNSLWADTTYLEFNVYNLSGDKLLTLTGTDSTPILQTSGQWGINSYDVSMFDDFSLYSGTEDTLVMPSLATDFTFTGNKESMKIWDSATYTIKATWDMTIVLSDDRGGRFAPNPLITASGDSNLIISLNSGNSYTATITYTATQAGLATITALGIGANKITKTNQVFVSPYVIVIGYIGDSITQGVGGTPNAVQVATTVLGTGFTAVNRGVSGSTTKSWVNSLLAGAISEFQSNGIEVVSIMLGTNDSKVAENISIDDYKTNLETIIIQLKSAGIKKIILNEPPYIIPTGQWDATSITKMLGYIDAIDELIDGETVLRGDTQAYEYFEVNQGELPDKIHPNVLGHEHLGTFRATAIKSVLEYQINPDHHFVDTNSHTLQTTGNLTFRVDKYFGEFSNVVKVDNIQLTTGYTATSGSTNITLDSDYLNTLSAGDHTLMVGFEGGVRVSDTFTILPSPVTPPVTPPNTPSYGWWGGGSSVSRDNCSNGDFSASYYDGECGNTPFGKGGSGEATGNFVDEKWGTESEKSPLPPFTEGGSEILTAYQFAYNHNITTLAPLENADPQGTVIRGHLAKMVVNYALNVLWKTLPAKIPANCHRKDGSNARESAEMKDYAVKACQLGLMGMDMDYFQPYAVVSRAQFGTILSRLLFGTTYAGGKVYYSNHLQALKEKGILTQIENPEARVELRQWVWLMLMRSANL